MIQCASCKYKIQNDQLVCPNCGFVFPRYAGTKDNYEKMLAEIGEEYRKANNIGIWKESVKTTTEIETSKTQNQDKPQTVEKNQNNVAADNVRKDKNELSKKKNRKNILFNVVKTDNREKRSRLVGVFSIVIVVSLIIIGVGGSIRYYKEMHYREARRNLEKGNTIKAVEILQKIDGYKDVDELLSEEEVVNARKYLEGKQCFEAGKYLEAMESFVDISHYEDSENYLIKAAKSYLRGLWSDDRETYTAYGYGFDETEFFVWDLKITGLIATKSYAERVYEYQLKDYYVFRDDEELHIAIECYQNGEVVKLEFSSLSENSFRCIEENAGYSRYELN